MAEKTKKEKPVLTDAEKQANKLQQMEDDFLLISVALRQSDDDKKAVLLKRCKGKLTQEFIDGKIKSKEITQKNADWLKEQGKIGAVRTPGSGKGKSEARPWRWQIDVDKDGLVGQSLIAVEEALAKLEKDHEGDFKRITKFFKDNDGVEKTFATYFAKKVVKEDGKTNGKK